MKKQKNKEAVLLIIAAVMVVGTVLFTACPEDGKDGTPGKNSYLVIFNGNGGEPSFDMIGILHGDSIESPVITTKTGYISKLEGWYKESELVNKWDFANDTVTSNITLYAKWVAYELGNTGPGGGKIFYRDPDGFTIEGYGTEGDDGYFESYTAYYLELAPSNFTSENIILWGDEGNNVAGITTNTIASSIVDEKGNGRKDTWTIVSHMEAETITGTAAQLCVEANIDGKNDWFLPSLGELNLLYQNKNSIDSLTGIYMSSSQYNGNRAWFIDLADGSKFFDDKDNYNNGAVRAIRAF